MTITVNGKTRNVESRSTISRLLEELELDPLRVAVELNRDIVPRERFEETPLSDGDQIEVVQFVGGG